MSETAILAMTGAIGATFGGLFTFLVAYLNRDKTRAEATQILMASALEVTGRLGSLAREADEREKIITELREELRDTKDQRDDTLKRITCLEDNDKKKAAAIIALQEEIERLDRLGKDKDRQIQKQAGEIETLQKQLASALDAQKIDRETIAGLYQTIESQNLTIEKLGRDLEKAETDRRRLESEMAQFKGETDDTVEIPKEVMEAARAAAATSPTEQPAHIGPNNALVLTAPDSIIKSDGGQLS